MRYRENKLFEKKFQIDGFASQRKYPNEALIQFLAGNYFSIPKNKRFKIKCLEIGCGSGANLWMIAREGFDTYGLDNAPTGLKLAKKMLKSWGTRAHLRIGSMFNIPYPDNTFDIVVDVVTMQHADLKGHSRAYKEVFRVLKPGGRFFQWHVGSESVSFKKSGGKKVDRLTVDNIKNSNVPLHHNGLICFMDPVTARSMLGGGFTGIMIDRVIRSYNNMQDKVEYLSIRAQKPYGIKNA